jgi:hypothetical protein
MDKQNFGPDESSADRHFHTFSGGVYVDRFAVTSLGIFSSGLEARKVEKLLKRDRPRFAEVWPLIEVLTVPERNFLTAVYVARSYEREFYEVLAAGKLPRQILLCQDTGDHEFGDQYYTYEFSPTESRQMFLEELLDYAQRDVSNYSSQLDRLKEIQAAGVAPDLQLHYNGEMF